MFLTVITSSKSPRIGSGLTYESHDPSIRPGSAVRVPLRRSFIEGIVMDVTDKKIQTEFDLKSIKEILGSGPLLTEAQLKTVRWMSEYYCCSLRQALGVWLPVVPWGKLASTSNPQPATVARSSLLVPLNKGQQNIFDAITSEARPSLLMTSPSYDRTELFAALVARTIHQKKQAIVLVPEIFLTDALIDRFYALLPRERISVLHSKLTPATRRDEWKRIHQGNVSLVIGSRSALFSPLKNLGLVIIDDEHEWTYKSEQTPRYHARETAEVLCRHSGAKLVLASASPSLEAWANVKSGSHHLASISGETEAKITVIDLAETEFAGAYPFSPYLMNAIADRLAKKEQSVLLLNRRGVSTAVLCLQCRHRMPSGEVPKTCPQCGSVNLKEIGAGTQRAERILQKHFPSANVVRADSDQDRHLDVSSADIVLGTQMIFSKKLARPTLAAALIADTGLSLPDFRASEHMVQRLAHLASTVNKNGEVILQTFHPDAPEIQATKNGGIARYLDEELSMRIRAEYPPAVPMVRLLLRGNDAEHRAKTLQQHALTLSLRIGTDIKATVGPLAKKPWWQVIIKGSGTRQVLSHLDLRDASVDVDPIETL